MKNTLPLCIVLIALLGAGDASAFRDEDCPSDNISDVHNDPVVQEALKDMWRDSQGGTPQEHEEGAWVYQCQTVNSDGSIHYQTVVVRWPHGDEHSVTPTPPDTGGGCRLVAYMHTHPGVGRDDPRSDDDWNNNHASPSDRTFAEQWGIGGIIRWGIGDNTTDIHFGADEPTSPSWECGTPAGSGTGGSHGDPHVRTLDGYTYDNQAIGDFQLLTAAAGDFEIQVRQQPYHSLRTASVNEVLAVRDGGDRIIWKLAEADPMVNGKRQPIPAGAELRLRGHGVIRHVGDDYVLFTSTGDRVTVTPAAEGLDFFVRLAAKRRGAVRGLLGNGDGDPDNDLVTIDGKLVTLYSTDKADASGPIYKPFANSWRVPADRSMLSPPFVVPAKVDLLSFPYPEVPVTPERVAAAEKTCRAAGITDSIALDTCVSDAVATGSDTFTASSVRAEKMNPPPAAVAPGATATPDQELIGVVDAQHPSASYKLALKAGTYFFDARGSRDTSWSVKGPDGVEVLDANQAKFMGEYPARLTLPAGAYTIQLSAQTDAGRGRFRFRIRTVPVAAAAPLALGVDAAGRIAAVGEEHRYLLKLRAGHYDFRSLGSDNVAWSLSKSNGDELFDSTQQQSMEDLLNFEVPADGTYTLTIRGREAVGIGGYRVRVAQK